MSTPGGELAAGQRGNRARGRQAGSETGAAGEYGQFTLRPDQVHKDDEIQARGMWVTVLDAPEPFSGQSGRLVTAIRGRRPDTGAEGMIACEPDAAVTVRRARGSTRPRHLKVTSAAGTVTYHSVYDDDIAAGIAAGAASVSGEPFPGDAPKPARALQAHAAAHGWNTAWVPGENSGSGKLTAVHPDHDYLQTAQEWQDGRKISRSRAGDEEYGTLRESTDIISGTPGRLPGQTSGEIAAEKLSGSGNHALAAVYMDDGDLSAAAAEFPRRLALTGDPAVIQEQYQSVTIEIGLRAAKDLPVQERAAPHAAAARLLADVIRDTFPDGKRMADSGVYPAPEPGMVDGADILAEAARHFDAGREREGVSALGRAHDYLRRHADLMGQPGRGKQAAAAQAAAEDIAGRARELRRDAADQLPLTDTDGRQVRPGDTVELTSGKDTGKRLAVTRWHLRTAHHVSPDRIRLVSRADGSDPEPAVPGTQPVSGNPAEEARDLAARLRGTSRDAPAGGRLVTASSVLEQAAGLFGAGDEEAARRAAAEASRAMHRYSGWAGIDRNYAARVRALASVRAGGEPASPAAAAVQLATDIHASPHTAGLDQAARLLDTAAAHLRAGREFLGTENLADAARQIDGTAASREDTAREAGNRAQGREPAAGYRLSGNLITVTDARAAADEVSGMAARAQAILSAAPPARAGRQQIMAVTGARAEWHLVHDDAAHRAVLENAARSEMTVTYDAGPPLAEMPKGASSMCGQAQASEWDVSYCRPDPGTSAPVHQVTAVSPGGRREISRIWRDARLDPAGGTLAQALQQIAGQPRSKSGPAQAGTRPRPVSRRAPHRRAAGSPEAGKSPGRAAG
jgi:hypothetical protein